MTQIVTIPGQGDAEFPDGMPPEQIAAAIQKSFPAMAKPAAAPAEKPGLLRRAADVIAAPIMTTVGAGEAALSAITGGVAAAGSTVGAIAGQVATGGLGDPAAARLAASSAAESAAERTYVPRTEAGKSILEGAGKVLDESKLAGMAPDLSLGVQGVRSGAAAAQQVRPPVAEAAGAAKGAIAAGAEKVGDVAARTLTPMPEARIAALAKKATDLGIPLRPDQLSSNRIVRMVGEALENVPVSGSKADQRQVGFNRAIGKLIGAEEHDRLTPDVFNRAMTSSGEKIGEIAAETPVRLDSDFRSALDSRKAAAARYETSDVGRIVGNYIDDLKTAGESGVIDGTKFRKTESKIGARIRTTPDGDLRNALVQLKEDMGDALERNIKSPERLAELKDARKQYAIGLTIEPLVAKATTTGNISPGGLLGRVTADKAGKRRMARGRGGELGDLAEIGRLFLKEPPSSGTLERAAAYGAIGGIGAGAFLEPHAAAAATGTIAAANVYNRAGPAIVKRALKNVEASKAKAPTPRRERKAAEEKQFLLRDAISAPEAEAEQLPLKKAIGE